MTVMKVSALLLQLVLPLALIARVGVVRERTRLSWGLDLALAISYLAAIALAAPWLALPWYLPWIFAAFLALAAVAGGRRAVDGAPDRVDPGEEPQTLEGNHVILDCGGTWVVLAHIQRGTVSVAEGSRLEAGDPIGQVGNSGRSDEPHLHLHAQTPGTDTAPLGGDPVPITVDGRHLVRNSRLHGR